MVAEALAKPVDGDVSSDAAALTDAFAVGEFYVRSAQMQPGEIPIVIGAGAIGLSAVAALAGRGIEPIIVVGLQLRAPRAGVRQLRRAHRRRPGRAVAVRRVARGARRTWHVGPDGRLRMRGRGRA